MGQKFTQNPDGTENLEHTCDKCGGPITHATELGMFCDKKCGVEEARKGAAQGEALIKALMGAFGNTPK
jgi:hypothetical protein